MAMKPAPHSVYELERWDHTAKRRRLLNGDWLEDLLYVRAQHFDGIRDDALGPCDLSSNAFRRIASEMAGLYTTGPKGEHQAARAESLTGPNGLLERSGLWSLMQRFQLWTWGCREYLMRPHIDRDGLPIYRPVAPDMVIAWASPDNPDQPVAIYELRRRKIHGEHVWTWDCVSIEDPEFPTYKVHLHHKDEFMYLGEDISAEILGGDFSGSNYPYRSAGGDPVLPYVLYHAEKTGKLWDPYALIEVVEGSLTASMLYTLYLHMARDSSWPQRWGINIQVPGGISSMTDRGPRMSVPADPASIIMFETHGDQPGSVGQFNAGADISEFGESISEYELRLAQYAGLPASDIQRVKGNARSGYSIALSNRGKREVQARSLPQMERGDLELIRLTAIMLNNRAGREVYPETGYSITYNSIPDSIEERRARREEITYEMGLGLLGPLDAYMRLYPGTTPDQAIAALDRSSRQRDVYQPAIQQISASPSSAAKLAQDLSAQVAAGSIPRSAAVSQLQVMLGLSFEQANSLI